MNCIQNKSLEIIATLSLADVAEFEKLDPEVLGKLTRWLGDLGDLLEWLTNSPWAEETGERKVAIDEFLRLGIFEE